MAFIDAYQPKMHNTATILNWWSSLNYTPTITTTVLRRSNTANFSRQNSNNYARKTFGTQNGLIVPSGDTFICGFGMYGEAWNTTSIPLMSVADTGTEHVSIRVNTGLIQALRGASNGTLLGTSASALDPNVWYYIEIKVKISNAAGTVDVKVNTASVLSLSGIDTQNTANATWNEIWAGDGGGSNYAVNFYQTDYYFLDGTDGTGVGQRVAFNDFLGDTAVDWSLAVAGNGANDDWTKSTGADAGACVDNATPDGSTYISSGTTGQITTVNLADLSGSPTIHAILPTMALTKSDVGSISYRPVWRIGGVNYTGTTLQAPSTGTYAYLKQLYSASPATSTAWTAAEFNGAELGPGIP